MIALLLACASAPSDVEVVPTDLNDTTCAVCGMDVPEQPAPRAQLQYRGGERRYLCSLGELRAWLQQPSPLGEPVGIWVEALDRDPPWIPADGAQYVFGAERPEVMGLPVLAFASPAAAATAAAELGTAPVAWTAVRDTPFHLVPPGGEK